MLYKCQIKLNARLTNVIFFSDQELQALLSEKDITSKFAENLLKQFGSEDLDIKEEILDEPMNKPPTTSTPITVSDTLPKTEAIKTESTTTTCHISPSDPLPEFYSRKEFRSDSVLKFETLDCAQPIFSIELDSKALNDKIL